MIPEGKSKPFIPQPAREELEEVLQGLYQAEEYARSGMGHNARLRVKSERRRLERVLEGEDG